MTFSCHGNIAVFNVLAFVSAISFMFRLIDFNTLTLLYGGILFFIVTTLIKCHFSSNIPLNNLLNSLMIGLFIAQEFLCNVDSRHL